MRIIARTIMLVLIIILGLFTLSYILFAQNRPNVLKLKSGTVEHEGEYAANGMLFDDVQFYRILQAIDAYGLDDNAKIEFQRAEELIKEYNYGEALTLLDNLIKKPSNTPLISTKTFLIKGKIYSKNLSQITKGLEKVKEAAKICPDSKIKLRIFYLLALAYHFTDPDQAIFYYKEILKEDFETAKELYISSRMGLSFLYLREEDLQNAMTYLIDAFIRYSEIGAIQEEEQYNLDEICEKFPIAEQNRKLCENFIGKYPEYEQECLKAFYTIAKKYELHHRN